MDRFVSEQNVAHYVSRLENGADAPTRATLLRLLLEEENMLGLTREQLARTDRDIDKLRRIIANQCDIVAGQAARGTDSAQATALLVTLNDLMVTYQLHRQRIVAAVADGRS